MRRKIVIHGSAGVVQDVARALGVKDSKLWVVKKNGRKVLQTADVAVAVGYVADESGMAQQVVRDEALNGRQLIDDAQIAWTIRQEMVSDVVGATGDAENFTPAMIEELRKQYGSMQTIDPGGEGYQKLVALLDRLTQPQLQTLAQANIKFVSNLARNRVRKPAGDAAVRRWGEADFKRIKAEGVTIRQAMQKIAEIDRRAAEVAKVSAAEYEKWGRAEWMKLADESDNWARYGRWMSGTLDATQMPHKKKDFAYKGYMIRYTMLGAIFIEKDGHGIGAPGSAKNEEEAKKIIDQLV